jgi:hypothetical protein
MRGSKRSNKAAYNTKYNNNNNFLTSFAFNNKLGRSTAAIICYFPMSTCTIADQLCRSSAFLRFFGHFFGGSIRKYLPFRLAIALFKAKRKLLCIYRILRLNEMSTQIASTFFPTPFSLSEVVRSSTISATTIRFFADSGSFPKNRPFLFFDYLNFFSGCVCTFQGGKD